MTVVVVLLPRWRSCGVLSLLQIWLAFGAALQDLPGHLLTKTSELGKDEKSVVPKDKSYNKLPSMDLAKALDVVHQSKPSDIDQDKAFNSLENFNQAMIRGYFQGAVDYFRAVPGIHGRADHDGEVISRQCLLDLMDLQGAIKARDTAILNMLSAQGSLYAHAGFHQKCSSTDKLYTSSSLEKTRIGQPHAGFYTKFCLAHFQGDSVGLCVPQSCSYDDLNQVLMQGFPVSYQRFLVCGEDLLMRKDASYTLMGLAVLLVVVVNLACTACITLYCYKVCNPRLCPLPTVSPGTEIDNSTDSDSRSVAFQILQSFNIVDNLHSLLSVEVQEGSIQCLAAVRVVSMTMVVFFHTVYYYTRREVYNKAELVSFFNSGEGIAVTKSNVCVEAFFVVSAMLAIRQAMTSVETLQNKHAVVFVIKVYCRRLWRLVPVYYLVVLCQTYLVPYWSDTPLYGRDQRRMCETSLWSHLTFTYNIKLAVTGISTIHCVPQAWYLCADMQLFLLVPWLALLSVRYAGTLLVGFLSYQYYEQIPCLQSMFCRKRRAGWLLVGLLPCLAFLLITLLGFYKNQNTWNATWILYSLPEHVNSYLSGLLLGLVHYRGHLRPRKLATLCLTLVFILCTYLVHSSMDAKINDVTTKTEIILSTSWRSCYGIMVAIVIYFCCVHQTNFLSEVLASPCWLPLSRLTYCVFLISCVIQRFYYQHKAAWPALWTKWDLVFDCSAFLTVSVVLSTAVWVCVEKPADNLSKLLWKRRKS